MKKETSPSAFELIEKSLSLLRVEGLSLFPIYWLGGFPFLLLFLFFWSDMSQNSFAEESLSFYSILLTGTYFWMKFWQTAFMRAVRYRILNQQIPQWSWKEKSWAILFQGFVQPTQWIVLPIAKILMIPFGYCHAFYETLHLTGDGCDRSFKNVLHKTWGASKEAPQQNHLLIWMMSPWMLIFGFALIFIVLTILPWIRPEIKDFPMENVQRFWLFFLACLIPLSPWGVLIFINIALILFGTPFLFQTFFGIDSAWTTGTFGIMDPFFMIVCLGITFLIMDPILKTAYVFRDLYARSQETGSDLLYELHSYRNPSFDRKFMVIGFLFLFFSSLQATSADPLSSSESDSMISHNAESSPWASSSSLSLDKTQSINSQKKLSSEEALFQKSLEKIALKREYQWKQERRPALVNKSDEDGWVLRFFKSLFQAIGSFYDWVMDVIQALFGKNHSSEEGILSASSNASITQYFLIIFLLILGVLILILLIRYLRKRRQKPLTTVYSPSISIPDLESHQTQATDLQGSEWETLAKELMNREEWRLASRAWYLGGLAELHEQRWIKVRKGKSNADYLQETHGLAKAFPQLYQEFQKATAIFEETWYGFQTPHREHATLLQNWVFQLRRTTL